MKKTRFAGLLACLFLLTACSGGGLSQDTDEASVHILATTYPVYLFTTAVAGEAEGVEISLLVNQQTSCLHDYTLTVNDMKAIERADVIVMNGVGLEDFMSDALAHSDAAVIDCSEGIELLPAQGHEGHDHDTEYDPHIWMDPGRAAQMVENIGGGLAGLDTDHAETYQDGARDAAALLEAKKTELRAAVASDQPDLQLLHRELITFHDGFQYFAQAFDLTILKSIEEEEGSEASAADIKEIVTLIETYRIPAIFTEVNGSDATAQAIARETGVEVDTLDMIMSGEGEGLDAYCSAISQNVAAVVNAMSEGQVTVE